MSCFTKRDDHHDEPAPNEGGIEEIKCRTVESALTLLANGSGNVFAGQQAWEAAGILPYILEPATASMEARVSFLLGKVRMDS